MDIKHKNLTCGLCNIVYDDEQYHPRVLPCLHILCFPCLHRQHQGNRVVCPYCNANHPLEDNDWSLFPVDYTCKDWRVYSAFLNNRGAQVCEMCAKGTPVSYRCKHCEIYICIDCMLIHERVRKLQHHKMLPIKDAETELLNSKDLDFFSAEVICSVHQDEVVRLFCSSCRTPICSDCSVIQHQGHVLSQLPMVYSEAKQMSVRQYNCLQNLISDIEKSMNIIEKEKKDIESHTCEQKGIVTAMLKKTEDILFEKELKLEKEIDDLCNQKLKTLQDQTESIHSLKHLCEEACGFLDHSLLFKKKPAFFEISEDIFQRLIQLNNMSFDKEPHTTTASLRYNMTENLNSLQNVSNSLVIFTNTNALIPLCLLYGSSGCFVNEVCNITFCVEYYRKSDYENLQYTISKKGKILEDKTLSGKKFIQWKPRKPGLYTCTLYSNDIKIAEKEFSVQKKMGIASKKKTESLMQPGLRQPRGASPEEAKRSANETWLPQQRRFAQKLNEIEEYKHKRTYDVRSPWQFGRDSYSHKYTLDEYKKSPEMLGYRSTELRSLIRSDAVRPTSPSSERGQYRRSRSLTRHDHNENSRRSSHEDRVDLSRSLFRDENQDSAERIYISATNTGMGSGTHAVRPTSPSHVV